MSLLFPAECGGDFLCPSRGACRLYVWVSSARLEFHVGYMLILFIGGFPAFGDGEVPV